ncbi:alpha-1,2-fucosyltransferase [Phocaeicola coprocola]
MKAVVFLNGGLGNQMFQYALYASLKNQGYNAKVNKEFLKGNTQHNGYELDKIFGIPANSNPLDSFLVRCIYYLDIWSPNIFTCIGKYLIKLSRIKLITDKTIKTNLLKISNYNIAYFCGYFQSANNFNNLENIFEIFHFKEDKISKQSKEILTLIKQNNAISIHVRRGDYLSEQNQNLFGGICTKEYYQKAIEIIYSKVNNPHFFIFSNDIEWCKKNINLPHIYYVNCNKGQDSWQDMFLMSKCKHNIIANSTFSWWGAYLNENPQKIIISPSKLTNRGDSPDLFPENWIKL